MLFNRHTTTLLSQKLIIFGGRKTAAYFNDLHVLDLGKIKTATDRIRLKQSALILTFSLLSAGFMEYTAVKSGNMPPLPRG